MASIKDDRGYNQGFRPSKAMDIRMERRCDALIKSMDHLDTETRILEIGCGTGEVSYMMSNKTKAHVVGTDLCIPFIDFANENFKSPNLSYAVLDFNDDEMISKLEFQVYDYIVGNGILHHLYYHLDDTLKRFKQLLRPDGKIIFFEPNVHNFYVASIFRIPLLRKWANLEPDEMAFSKQFISKKLQERGFSNLKIEYKDFLLPITPKFLITSVISLGNVLEKIPLLRSQTQSLFIEAQKI